MRDIKKALLLLPILLFSLCVAAQQNPSVQEQEDFMRSNGKIYVVMAVVVTIVLGLFIYLFNLDRKINKLERNIKD